jgi:hypothetical protein
MRRALHRFTVSLLLASITALAPVAPAWAAADLPVFKKGDDYGAVRNKMIKAGWTPYHAPDADACREGDARCAGRPEMVACAGSGLANCKFLWKKKSETVALCTTGEGKAVFSSVCEPD